MGPCTLKHGQTLSPKNVLKERKFSKGNYQMIFFFFFYPKAD